MWNCLSGMMWLWSTWIHSKEILTPACGWINSWYIGYCKHLTFFTKIVPLLYSILLPHDPEFSHILPLILFSLVTSLLWLTYWICRYVRASRLTFLFQFSFSFFFSFAIVVAFSLTFVVIYFYMLMIYNLHDTRFEELEPFNLWDKDIMFFQVQTQWHHYINICY